MTVNLSSLAGAGQQFFSDSGVPLNGGKLHSYAAGTTTPQTCYTSATGATPHTNPIILNSAGRIASGEIWLTAGSNYKFVLTDSSDVLIATWDNVPGVNDTTASSAALSAFEADLANNTNAAKGDALVGFQQSNASGVLTSATGKTVHAKLQEILSVKDFGAKGDGSTDDAAAILAALTACTPYGTVIFPAGTYVIGSQINIPQSNITIDGQGATLVAKAAVNFEYMLLGTNLTNVTVKNLVFNANQANRVSGQNVRFMCAGFTSGTDCKFINCTAKNTLGYSSVPAVGLTLGGVCVRCQIVNCTAIDCGIIGKASDAFYTSGNANMIIGSEAVNVTDTGFVIEASNTSGIIGCIANNCAAAAAITNILNTDVYGNFIDGLTALDTTGGSGVTGQIQIGTPLGSSTGNLYDTSVSNVVMVNNAVGTGAGAAINIRKTGTPKAKRVTISNVRIRNSQNQGVVVDGDEVMIHGCDFSNITENAIQILSGSLNCSVIGCTITGGLRGIVTAGTAELVAHSNFVKSFTNYGMYAFDTSTISAYMNTVETTVGIARYGKDGGATLNIVTAMGNYFAINNATGSAPVGALVDKFLIVDRTGNSLGYVPIYNS